MRFKSILFSVIFSLIFTLWPNTYAFAQPAPDISAQSAILLDARSGIVIFEKNADAKLSMASTTKIMTVLLAIESGRLDEQFKVTSAMIKVEGSSMGLCEGDVVTLRALCFGMMLSSGNDAANAAAIYMGGSIPEFAKLMNRKAAEIGMADTCFVTPSGLDAQEHYSTARDMAKLAEYAMENSAFSEMAASKKATISFGDPVQKRTLTNHNKLLAMYDGACGIKTGFTKKSGRCLVSSVQKEGGMLIAVTLNAPNDWDDHINLYDYGFSQMELCTLDSSLKGVTLPVAGGKAKELSLVAQELSVLVPNGFAGQITRSLLLSPFSYAPVKEGDTQGEIVYYLNNKEIARAAVYAADNISALYASGGKWLHRLLRNLLLLLSS